MNYRLFKRNKIQKNIKIVQIPLHKLQKSKRFLKLPKLLKFYMVSKMENVNIYLITSHYWRMLLFYPTDLPIKLWSNSQPNITLSKSSTHVCQARPKLQAPAGLIWALMPTFPHSPHRESLNATPSQSPCCTEFYLLYLYFVV